MLDTYYSSIALTRVSVVMLSSSLSDIITHFWNVQGGPKKRPRTLKGHQNSIFHHEAMKLSNYLVNILVYNCVKFHNNTSLSSYIYSTCSRCPPFRSLHFLSRRQKLLITLFKTSGFMAFTSSLIFFSSR